MDKIICIYKISNHRNKVYIGQTNDYERRISEYKRLHCKQQPGIYNSLKKYGIKKHTFSILEICNLEDLNIKERYYQEIYEVNNRNGLNCCFVDTNTNRKIVSQETKNKISESKRGKKRPNFSKEWIQNMSKSRIGRKMPPRTDQWIKKQSDSHKGQKMNYNTRIAIYNSKIKKVVQYNSEMIFIEEFESIKKAAEKFNKNPCIIVNCLNGRQKTAFGYYWKRI